MMNGVESVCKGGKGGMEYSGVARKSLGFVMVLGFLGVLGSLGLLRRCSVAFG